ncbi:hypothetical protein FA95DRAFT_1524820 [Auriscalpium vulgare]|uniref:Uncharacterized protein n=1 Tax=Auriscalpium vulgare TaxID=40419 RepID=A0ACB8RGT1_9AGAM|nr:hypothetical protein FA95DRAFT_1524820 [Auriscalpium vulgare]
MDYRSFDDNKSYLKLIDELPGPLASWRLTEITVQGNVSDGKGNLRSEVLDLWSRDPVEVIQDLISHPDFDGDIAYAPEEVRDDMEVDFEGTQRIYEEMCDSEWWKETMDALPPGVTVAPVILASDKTHLSTFSGDKQAWPVYLTIGNISKAVRRRPSKRATVLLGYIPVTKLLCFEPRDRQAQGYRLFHYAMSIMLKPLVDAGQRGVEMNCADGRLRHVFPILAAYIADFPEQCLITCCKQNRCPICKVRPDQRGDLLDTVLYRDPLETLTALAGGTDDDLADVNKPFWADLPHANIFRCITPDLLHQLHKGVFKDHLVKWTTADKALEVDERFKRVPVYPGLRIFHRGISKVSQWTGNEYRQMEKVFLPLICGLHDDPRVILAARALIDFIYLAHFPAHTTSTLSAMRQALHDFHHNKRVFVDMGQRGDFNIPKFHALNHYIPAIMLLGSCDGLSTEISERLHIDYAKQAYRSSNRKQYLKQMVVWLTRKDKIAWFESFVDWAAPVRRDTAQTPVSNASYDDEAQPVESTLLPNEGVLDATPTVTITMQSVLPSNSEPVTRAFSHTQLMNIDSSPPPATLPPGVDDANAPDAPVPSIPSSSPADVQSSEEESSEQSNTLIPAYRIARRPGLRFSTADTIQTVHSAPHFSDALRAFLVAENPSFDTDLLLTLDSHYYGVFSQFRRTLPSLRGAKDDLLHDVVHASPSRSPSQRSSFSTVIFLQDRLRARRIGLDGYRIGQVRVIFELPTVLQSKRSVTTLGGRHLAYVELFTEFTEQPERYSRLFKVARTLENMQRKAAIIPLSRIFRSCLLIPDCGTSVNLSWTPENVLEEAELFYLCPFSDHHMYLFAG